MKKKENGARFVSSAGMASGMERVGKPIHVIPTLQTNISRQIFTIFTITEETAFRCSFD
jgi:hypothetical protein